MEIMLKQVQKLISVIVVWITLPIFLLSTNPETLALPLLIAPFIILLVGLYLSASLFLGAFFHELPLSRRKTMAGIFASLPTLLLLLASIRQLTIRDMAIVIGLLGLLMFYLKRLDFIKKM